MKIFFISLVTLCLACAFSKQTSLENSDQIFGKSQIKQTEGGITAILNEYADKLFLHIGKFAVGHDLDPTHLDDIHQNFLVADVKLSDGKLHGISTIERYEDVILRYSHDLKKLYMVFPIEFTNLNFTYDYHLILLMMGPKGKMTGKIKDFSMYLALSFDFNTYHAMIEKIETRNTGAVTLTFHGHILDMVVNILSQFVTAVLHPLLVLVIEGIVKNVANIVVKDINNNIDHLLNRTFVEQSTYTVY